MLLHPHFIAIYRMYLYAKKGRGACVMWWFTSNRDECKTASVVFFPFFVTSKDTPKHHGRLVFRDVLDSVSLRRLVGVC